MPPVWRYHHGTSVLVPFTLVDAVESAFAVDVFDGESFGLDDDEQFTLERLCTVPRRPGHTHVVTDVAVLTRARNTLDGYTLSSECDGSYDTTAPPAVNCGFCVWCQALVLRDWCDEILDRAGMPVPPYMERTPPTSDMEAEYDRMCADANAWYADTSM